MSSKGKEYGCPFTSIFRCTKCGHLVETSGPCGFYRDKQGKRKPHSHLSPVSYMTAQRGNYGYFVEWFCPECGEVYDVVVFEQGSPCWSLFSSRLENYAPPEDWYKQAICPQCDTKLQPNIGGLACPSCKKGILKQEQESIEIP